MFIKEKENFNFGFNAVMHYIDNVKGLKELFDLRTPLEENKGHNGGVLIKAFNVIVQATMHKQVLNESVGFDVVITDPLGNMVFMFMHNGEELQDFFENMLVNMDLE